MYAAHDTKLALVGGGGITSIQMKGKTSRGCGHWLRVVAARAQCEQGWIEDNCGNYNSGLLGQLMVLGDTLGTGPGGAYYWAVGSVYTVGWGS